MLCYEVIKNIDLVESHGEANRIHRVLRTKEEIEEQNKRNLDRQRKAKEERRVRMEEKKAKLWADNGKTSFWITYLADLMAPVD